MAKRLASTSNKARSGEISAKAARHSGAPTAARAQVGMAAWRQQRAAGAQAATRRIRNRQHNARGAALAKRQASAAACGGKAESRRFGAGGICDMAAQKTGGMRRVV
jgi:hypothetical protein